MANPDLKLRRFLKQSVCLFCFSCLNRCTSPENKRQAGQVKLSQISKLKEGITSFKLERVALIRTSESLKAVSLVCTHQTCILNHLEESKFTCPCHGGEFNIDGTVLRGPPKENLPFFEIMPFGEDSIKIDFSRTVSPEWSFKIARLKKTGT